MGLFICKSILDSCNGRIQAFSEGENKGTTFEFSMPMKIAPNRRPNTFSLLLKDELGDNEALRADRVTIEENLQAKPSLNS